MRVVIDLLSPRSFARAFALLSVGLSVANCSSDAVRLNSNPFATLASETTGSVPPGQVESRPSDPQTGVQAQPLPAPAAQSSNGADLTGAVPQLRADPKAKSGWTWEGGTPVTVVSGDTLVSLAKRYGVPASAIAEANGLSGPAALRPGQRLVIPRYNAGAAGSSVARPPQAAATSKLRAPMSSVHVVAPGETLVGIARRYNRPITEIATANKIAPHTMVKMGDRLIIPGKNATGTRIAAVAADPQPAPPPAAAAPARAAAAPATAPARAAASPAPVRAAAEPTPVPQRLASLDPTPSVRVATPVTEAIADEPAAAERGTSPAFRWPVRGRVIAGFGSKTNGQQNDGINLAVPEGTAIRASEDGVVAYAGSELKGYGNLILIRHANGFVTAYAHASEIMVKRNDQVRRGQVIAKSGQTGTVASPQLHFEIRKGSSPVDPMQHLPSGA